MTDSRKTLEVAGFFLALALAAGCATRTAPAPHGPVVMQRCPDESDGPSILAGAVLDAHHALSNDPGAPVLPACVLDAVGDIAPRLADSLRLQAVAQADEGLRRAADDAALLAARVKLLSAAGRHAEAVRGYDRLIAADSSKATVAVSRRAIASAYAVHDTAALMRAMTRSLEDPEIGSTVAYEMNVLRQAGPLWTAVNDAKATVRRYPSVTNLFPSLVTNLGTLGLPDSVAVYLRLGIDRGIPRSALAPSLESLVASMSRRSILYGDIDGWQRPLAGAFRVDSVLPTPASRFLVAALVARAAAVELPGISDMINAGPLEDGSPGPLAAGCARIPPLVMLLDAADQRMRLGGNGYGGANAGVVSSGLAAARERVAELRARCA